MKPVLSLLESNPESLQPQGIANHRQRAETHGGTGPDGTNEQAEKWIQDAGSNRNADDVVNESQKQILPDSADGLAAQLPSCGDDFHDAELPRHYLGSRSAIAGEHDDVHAVLSKAAKRLQGGRPDGIGHA